MMGNAMISLSESQCERVKAAFGFLDEDVEDIPRYTAVPGSARFNWLARAPDVCLGDADDAAFDATCVQEEATVLLSLVPEEWEDYCHPGDAA